MRFQIGNKVRVLDENLEGQVIAIQGNEITLVTPDDFEFTFLASELVVVANDQRELSKFSDINHPLLKEKMVVTKKPASSFKKDKREVVLEVDLHIEQLLSNKRNMDSFDILNYQLRVAKQKLEWALSKRIHKLVFIHGVGDGILKQELLLLLQRYPVKFYEASFKKYGYGATEVLITA